MIIHLVRHAEYSSQSPGHEDYAANAEAPLSDFGRIEARALAKELQSLGVDRIFHSPFRRARETAEIVHSISGIPLETLDDLHEHRIILPTKDRMEWKRFRDEIRRNHDLKNDESESFNDAVKRFRRAIARIATTDAKRPAAISHSLFLQAALSTIGKLDALPHLDTISISTIDVDSESIKLLSVNQKRFSWPIFLAKVKRKLFAR